MESLKKGDKIILTKDMRHKFLNVVHDSSICYDCFDPNTGIAEVVEVDEFEDLWLKIRGGGKGTRVLASVHCKFIRKVVHTYYVGGKPITIKFKGDVFTVYESHEGAECVACNNVVVTGTDNC